MQSFCKNYWHKLRSSFNLCAESEYNGTKGVVVIEGESSGKTAGITICTHGNEPVGLSLLHDNSWLKPDRGRVIITLNNIEASRIFFGGNNSSRYIERNMNRLPNGLEGCCALETKRAQELKPIWNEFDAGSLDVHSTSTPFPPMLIMRESTHKKYPQIFNKLPAEALLTGLIRNFTGQPAIDFYAEDTPKAIIECGQHHDENGAIFLRQCVEQWLFNLGLKNSPPPAQEINQAHYHITQAVWLPDNGEVFSYINPITPFAKIEVGQTIAKGNLGTIITSPASGYAVMAPASEPLPTKEEFFFLAEKYSLS